MTEFKIDQVDFYKRLNKAKQQFAFELAEAMKTQLSRNDNIVTGTNALAIF